MSWEIFVWLEVLTAVLCWLWILRAKRANYNRGWRRGYVRAMVRAESSIKEPWKYFLETGTEPND